MAKRKKLKRAETTRYKASGKRHHQKSLDWLLSFLNTNISTLTDPSLGKMLYEFLIFFFGGEDETEKTQVYSALRSAAGEFREELQRRQDEIRLYLDKLWDEMSRSPDDGKWHAALGRPLQFNVPFEVYLKRDGVTVGPHFRHLRRRGTSDGRGGVVRTFGDDFSGIAKHRVLKLLANFSLSCITTCPDCSGLYRATDKKKEEICRRCLQRKTTQQWKIKNKEVLKVQRYYQQEGNYKTIGECRKELGIETRKGKRKRKESD